MVEDGAAAGGDARGAAVTVIQLLIFHHLRLRFMPRNGQKLSKVTEKLVYQEASSRCSFCDVDDIRLLEIHHIEPRSKGGSNELSNLILVCRNCHARVESGLITNSELMRKKQELRVIPLFPRGVSPVTNSLVVEGNVNSSIVGNSITIIGGGKKLPQMAPPPGTIGADLERKNYIEHLIGRYHKFRKIDPHYGRTGTYDYAVIRGQIKDKFKASTSLVPLSRFDDLVRFLQAKIDQTIQGKRNRSEGIKNYSSFDDYVRKLLGT
ncbi:MAG TPA: HNH endonuclease [Longimicrobium sp.]|nr:HNH endonuclease [Longimicrobium sp.]